MGKIFFHKKLYLLYYLLCLVAPLIVRLGFGNVKKITSKEATFLCNFNSSTKTVHSSKKDVVFFYASELTNGLELAVKSLRTTGSLCRIVLFVPESFKYGKFYEKMFEFLEVEIVKCKDKLGRNDVD
jgi:hypothetical protein